jgi:hypothetical protein
VPSTLPLGLTATLWPIAHSATSSPTAATRPVDSCPRMQSPRYTCGSWRRADRCRKCRRDRLRPGPGRVAASGLAGPLVRSVRLR